jgi:hypothetical protein
MFDENSYLAYVSDLLIRHKWAIFLLLLMFFLSNYIRFCLITKR